MSEKYIPPFMLSGDNDKALSKMFDGKVPKVGDAIEMVCYEVSTSDSGMRQIRCKWRVKDD
jgi:hypothetical protein